MTKVITVSLSPHKVYCLLMEHFTTQPGIKVKNSLEASHIDVRVGSWTRWGRGPPGIVKVDIGLKNGESELRFDYNYNKTYIIAGITEAFWLSVFFLASSVLGMGMGAGEGAALIAVTFITLSTIGNARYHITKFRDEIGDLLKKFRASKAQSVKRTSLSTLTL